MGLGSQDDEGASDGLQKGAVNCLLLQSSCLGRWSVLLPGCKVSHLGGHPPALWEELSSTDHGLCPVLGAGFISRFSVPTDALGCEPCSQRFWNSPVRTDLLEYCELLRAGPAWSVFEHVVHWPCGRFP